MKYGNLKRLLALFLVLVMCFSMLPVSAFAEGEAGDDPVIEEPKGDPPESVTEEPPHEHSYVPVVTAPTCTEGGYTTWTCSCGDSYTDSETDPLGHDWANVEALAPTCTAAGREAGVVCSRCGAVQEGCAEIPAAGHTPVEAGAVPATCTETGREAGKVCSVCGEVLEGCVEIPLAEHTRKGVDEIPAEVGKAGVTAGVVCAVCGEVLEGCEEIPALEEPKTKVGTRGGDSVASGTCGENLTWTLDADGVLTISGTGAMTDFENGAAPWFGKSVSVTQAVIEDGVTSIGNYAFCECDTLTGVSIPASVASIGNFVFTSCGSLQAIQVDAGNSAYCSDAHGVLFSKSMDTLVAAPGALSGAYTIPSGVVTIYRSAFVNCAGLTGVTIPNTVATIYPTAFGACTGLSSISIPASVTTIGFSAFLGCSSLQAIQVDAGNTAFCNDARGVLFDKNMETLIAAPGALAGEYAIPEGVTRINGSGAFNGCANLTAVTIPDGVTVIETLTFYECSSLTSVSIPASIEAINDSAFGYCEALAEVNFGGSPSQWSAITVGDNNEVLSNAQINYAQEDPSSDACGENLTWTLDDGVLTVAGTGDMYNFIDTTDWGADEPEPTTDAPWFEYRDEIQTVVIGSGVTSVGDYAFYPYGSLTAVSLPDSLTSIGGYAFMRTGLTEAAIPVGVTQIGAYAFAQCSSLASVTIPEGVTAIPDSAFVMCTALETVVLPNGVELVDSSAFYRCTSLSSATIPATVTNIGEYAFGDCPALAEIFYGGTEEQWGLISIGDGNNLNNVTIHFTETPVGVGVDEDNFPDEAFRTYVSANIDSDGNGVLTEDEIAAVTAINVENLGIASLEGISFFTSLQELNCRNNSLTELDVGGCPMLHVLDCSYNEISDLTLGSESQLFTLRCQDNQIDAIDLESCPYMTRLWCWDNPITLLDIGPAQELINAYVYGEVEFINGGVSYFAGHTDLSVNVETDIISPSYRISYSANGGEGAPADQIKEYDVPLNLATDEPTWEGREFLGWATSADATEVEYEAGASYTANANLTLYAVWGVSANRCGENLVWSLNGGVLTITGTGDMYDYQDLTDWSVEGAEFMTDAPWFEYRSEIQAVEIGSGVTGIGAYAFAGTGLTEVAVPSGVTSFGAGAFRECGSLVSVNIPDGVTAIPAGCFRNCGSLTGLTLPSGVTVIGELAFRGCVSLAEVNIPDGVTMIPNDCFYDCGSLQTIEIPSGVTEIGFRAFMNCASLTELSIPSGVTEIGFAAFNGCTGLTRFSIPSSLTDLMSGLFDGCTGLEEIVIPSTVQTIWAYVFQNCTSLTEITIPDGVWFLDQHDFDGCTSLQTVRIPASMREIRESVFANCTELAEIFYGGTEAQWSQISIGDGNEVLNNVTVHFTEAPSEIAVNEDNFPDEAFRAYIGANFDLDGSGILSAEEIAAVTAIDVERLGVASIEGIAYFTSLTELNCRNNSLTELDVSGCPMLHNLDCSYNEISDLNLGSGSFLFVLRCQGNRIESIDLSDCPYMTQLWCWDNAITRLEIEPAQELINAYVYGSMERFDGGVSYFVDPTDLSVDAEVEVISPFYQIRYSANGGTDEPWPDFKSHGEPLQLTDAVPTREGYDFLGWAPDADAAAPVYLPAGTYTANGNATLFAVWRKLALPPLVLDQDYLLMNPGNTKTLTLVDPDEEWAGRVDWKVVEEYHEGDGETPVIVLTPNGTEVTVEATAPGTAFVEARIPDSSGASAAAIRCRVDVVQTGGDQPAVSTVRLIDAKATVELYKKDYTRITVLPELKQNGSNMAAELRPDVPHEPEAGTGVAITGAEFADSTVKALFALRVVDDRTLEIIPEYEKLQDEAATGKEYKGSYKSAIRVTLAGNPEPITTETQLALTVKKTLPKVAVNAVKFNSFLLEDTHTLDFKGTVMDAVEIDETKTTNPDWVELTDDQTGLRYTGARNGKSSGKLNLLVWPEGWAVRVPVTVSVSAASTKPKLTLKPTSLTLKPVGDDSVTTAVTVTPAEFTNSDVFFVRVLELREGSTSYDMMHPETWPITVDPVTLVGSALTVKLGPVMPDTSQAHTYTLILGIIDRNAAGDDDSVCASATLTVKLLAKQTAKLTLKTTGGIDLAVDNSPVTIVPTIKNVGNGVTYTITDIRNASGVSVMGEDLFATNDLTITAKAALGNLVPAGKQAKFTATVTANYSGGSASADVPFTVKHSAKVPTASVTLKAAGGIDVIRPNTELIITPTIKNCYTHRFTESDLRILRLQGGKYNDVTGTDADPFVKSLENGVYTLKLKTDSRVSHLTDKFKVCFFCTDIETGTVLKSSEIALPVKMGSAKFTQSTKTVNLLKTDKYSSAPVTVSLNDPSLAGIDWDKTLEKYTTTTGSGYAIFRLQHLSGDTVLISFQGAVKAGTVKIPVFLIGNESDKANATISVSVKLA